MNKRISRKQKAKQTAIDLMVGEYIIGVVAEVFGFPVYTLKKKRRFEMIVIPRHLAIKIIRDHTQLSLLNTGGLFWETIDHTTVMNSIQTANDLLEYNQEVIEKYKLILNKLHSYERKRVLPTGTAATFRKACRQNAADTIKERE